MVKQYQWWKSGEKVLRRTQISGATLQILCSLFTYTAFLISMVPSDLAPSMSVSW